MSPKSSVLDARRELGESASSDAGAEHRRHDDRDRGVAADPGTRPASAIASAATTIAGRAAEQERHAGERGEHQPGEDRVRERLGRVGELVEDDPAAERPPASAIRTISASARCMNGFLERRRASSGGGGGVGGSPAAAAGDLDDLAAVGGFQHRPVERLAGRADGDLRAG